MTLQGAAEQQIAKYGELGKSGLNLMYPNEFELYLCALELTDQHFNTLRYFVFPVMPNSIEESMPQLNNVKKTAGGVTSLSNPTFNPTEINLQGTFGRKFRVVLGTDITELVSSFTTASGQVTTESILGGAANFFDNRIKTGYGCIKILQDIIEQSRKVDNKGIRRLIFYNLALGNSYLVKASNLRFNQSLESNMVWNYTLPLKSIAPLSAVKNTLQLEYDRVKLIETGYAQKESDRVINALSTVLGNGINNSAGAVIRKGKSILREKEVKAVKSIVKAWK